MTLEQKYRDIYEEGQKNALDILAMLIQGKTKAELLADGFDEKTIDKAIETIESIKKD